MADYSAVMRLAADKIFMFCSHLLSSFVTFCTHNSMPVPSIIYHFNTEALVPIITKCLNSVGVFVIVRNFFMVT